MDTELLNILRLARAQSRKTALQRLRSYLKSHPDDAEAWLVLGGLAPDNKIRLSALQHAVHLAPENSSAQAALSTLQAQLSAPPIPTTIPAPKPTPPPPSPAQTSTPTSRAAQPHNAKSDFEKAREARAILWPFPPRGQKPCPLGELLDAELLTRQDLIWAKQEANEQEIRAAASIILETSHRLPDVNMTLNGARLIAWPFRNRNRPLGDLVESGTLKVKDLRQASWFAKSPRVREAARLMLPVACQRNEAGAKKKSRPVTPPKPAPKPPEAKETPHSISSKKTPPRAQSHPMPIIQGANYLAHEIQHRYKQQIALLIIGGVLIMAGLGALIYVTVLIGSKKISTPWPLWAILGAMFFLGVALSWLEARFTEIWQEKKSYRQGQQGEIKVARELRKGLGGSWILFRNVQLPGGQADIDMVLLGPPGLFALEVKAYSGKYRYHKEHFYRRSTVGWRKTRNNPGKQARAEGGTLHDYIAKTIHHDFWVEPRLVWVGPGHLELQEPQVYVWFLDNLDKETERLRAMEKKFTAEEQAMIAGLLHGLCSTLQ